MGCLLPHQNVNYVHTEIMSNMPTFVLSMNSNRTWHRVRGPKYSRMTTDYTNKLINGTVPYKMGFPGGPGGKKSACQCRRGKRCRLDSQVGKILWSRKWHVCPVFLPGKFRGQRSLVGYSSWGRKETDMTEQPSTAHRQIDLNSLFPKHSYKAFISFSFPILRIQT